MLDRAEDAWAQWWNDNINSLNVSEANRSCLRHVLQQVLGVRP
jgi:hypothetical protein